MTGTDLVPTLERTYACTNRVLRAVPGKLLDTASPCAGWTVRDVTNHLVGAHLIFARVVEGEAIDPAEFAGGGSAADHLGTDPAAAFDAAASRCAAAFGKPGALEETFPFAFGPAPGFVIANISLSETLVHGWDIACAAGLDYLPDDAAVAAIREFQSQAGDDEDDRRAGGMFAPALTPPPGATPLQELLAYLGRLT
jgi:uncharacterized protein (TIGR03086 family)